MTATVAKKKHLQKYCLLRGNEVVDLLCSVMEWAVDG